MSLTAAPRIEPKLQLCVLHVVRIYDLTPHMRRIVLGGRDLENFDVPTNALGPYIKLLIPPNGIEPEWPTLSDDGRLIWPALDRRPVMRTYSVRHFDKDACELHVDFVMHGDRGVASAWAARAKAGDPVGLWGPGCTTTQNIDWYLFAGDQTALPAIAFILENLPATARGEAYIEIPDESEKQIFGKPSGVDIKWLLGKKETPVLQDAVKAASWPAHSRVFVWAGAESATARSIRSHMKTKHGLDRDQMYILNYWRRGQAEGGFGYLD
ncbi:siderophore-interacting protein [Microvirga sp. ACRRW]|uniref:siderophore-interacting protein n=1 Tax=Microvirga sp. ACRRW TaxID=2918205 RepID=UPI001EF59DED|nr:siderophore-interacting protein [Microvirga sp. ACRRW]MCG7393635.1 siderophore-interacting protein [Microvirga sp. ACRRW]